MPAKSQQGMALITSLLLLSFLTIVGGALLATTTVDLKIAENYRTNTQLLFLTKAGLETAREALRGSVNELSVDLATAAGVDGTLSTATDLATLLASDDQPLLPADSGLRATGESLVDPDGNEVGTYHVFIRNDPADIVTSTVDTNDILTFLTIARIGDTTRAIEADVLRGSFPPVPAALTLNGGVGLFDAANSNLFRIDGNDAAGSGNNENAVGVISAADDTTVTDAIPENRQDQYTGAGGVTPDVADVSGELSGVLTTVDGLEGLTDSIEASATDLHTPGFGNTTAIGDIGSSTDYRVVVVNGNCEFGPGTGYGTLLIRGSATFSGNFNWNGLILVIGQGEIHWNGGGNGEVQGGLFIAKTRDTPTADEPLGEVLASRGNVIADFNGGGGNGIIYNTETIANASGSFPYTPISIREY